MKIKLPLVFSQFDTRWAKTLLGFNTDPQYNFYDYACLISSLAAVSDYFGFDETPTTINDKLKALGPGVGFTAGSGNYVWGAITKLHKEITEKKTETPNELTDSQMGEIKTALDQGYPVIIQIDVNPKTAKNDTHYVTVVDYSTTDENDLTIADPLGGQLVSLKKYLGWLRPSARKSIYKYIIYTGPKPTNNADEFMQVPVKVYPNLVHGSTEWDKTSAEYLPGKDPKSASFEDVQRVVNGYKSDATASKSKLDQAIIDKELALKEAENQKDKLANTQKECQRTIDLKNAEITALKQSQPNTDILVKQYKGTIEALETQLKEANKAKGIAELKVTELETKLEQQIVSSKNSQNVITIVIQAIIEQLGKIYANRK